MNRFLLDGIAYAGRGEVEYVTLDSKAEAAAERFYKRVDAPVLTDVAIDWGNLPVADVYPKQVPDLFSAKPVLVHGRLTGEVKPGAAVTLRGNTAAGPFERKVELKPSPQDASHEALASLWARTKVDDLMMRDLGAMQSGSFPEDLKNQITALGVEFKLMTQFTSFVAVEELTITKGGRPMTISVPVEMPEGVRGGIAMSGFGGATVLRRRVAGPAPSAAFYSRSLAVAPGQQAAQEQASRSPSSSASAPASVAAGTTVDKAERKTSLATADADRESVREEASKAHTPVDPLLKLDESLRDLADKVARQGKDGSLTAGPVAVSGYKVDVMIYLSDTSPKTREALKKLGFEQSAESKAVRLLIGTIDVRKLKELAKLESVLSVKPVGA